MHLRARLVGHIAALGFSSFVVELSGGLVLLVLNLVILAFEGTIGVAAYGVVANFAFVASALFVGIAQGIQPLASNAYARGSDRDVRAVLRLALLTALVIAATTYAAVALAAEPLALAFNRDNDPQLTALAVDGMRVYFLGYFFAGANIVAAAFFSAVEKPAVRAWPCPSCAGFRPCWRSPPCWRLCSAWRACGPRSPRPRRPRSR